MAKVSVLGSGSWGTAMAMCLANNGHNILLWSRNEQTTEELTKTHINEKYLPDVVLPENINFTSDISKCADADVIIVATPSHTVRQVCKAISPYIKDGQIIVSISKGFDEENYNRLSQVIAEEIPNCKVAAMSGPSHAEEVVKKLPTTNVVACKYIEVSKYIQEIFISEHFRIYTTDDIVGVELGGSLKNVIALCSGISDGLGYGDNTKAALMTRGMAEIIRLGLAMGAKYETFTGLSGIGDLIVTCTSMNSRNRRAGILIVQGKSLEEAQSEVKMVVEGVKTAQAVKHLADKYNVEIPICQVA
ncbi:MAG: NAD(P)-dependent glycerol-3-phosphate dehydrogenase, partial [Clostridia bacterium]|nr:NAD(P)-dependent glycerol-3-phosphate dehydrogenase [Clostridia bacterium]